MITLHRSEAANDLAEKEASRFSLKVDWSTGLHVLNLHFM
jgi:hypothetical protein